MAPLKKPQNTARLPLALKPLKSKNVLAVLAERTQSVLPVGAWVEPASADSSEIPAYTSAYIIEEELKEQLRKKQEALKCFQRQVKLRVNHQMRLRKKQQLQKSYEAVSSKAEKEGFIAMQSSDPAFLTTKRRSVFPYNLNGAIGISRLPPSQMIENEVEDGENQNELFQKQAEALSQTMRQARHRLASFKTVREEKASVFPDDGKKSFPTQEESDYEELSSVMTYGKEREDLFGSNQQGILSEDKDKPFSRVQKVTFKNPLFVVMDKEDHKQLHLQDFQDILPEAQDYFPEAQQDLLESKGNLTEVQTTELEVQSFEPDTQAIEPECKFVKPEGQAIGPEGQAVKTETQGVTLKAQHIELEDGSIVLEAQDSLPVNQTFLPKDHHVLLKDQNILPKCQDQDFLPKDQEFLPQDFYVLLKDQNILLKCQNQKFLPTDQNFLPRDQKILLPNYQDQDFLPRDQCVLTKEQNVLPQCQQQDFLPKDQCGLPKVQHVLSKDQNILPEDQDQEFLPKDQYAFPKDQYVLPKDQIILPKNQDQDFLPKEQYAFPENQYVLPKDQIILPENQDQDFLPKDQCALSEDQHVLSRHQNILPKDHDQYFLHNDQSVFPQDQRVFPKDQNILPTFQDQEFLTKDQEKYFWPPAFTLTAERWKKEWPVRTQQYVLHRCPGQSSFSHQLDQKEEERQEKANLKQPTSTLIGREALPPDVHQDLLCRLHQVFIRDKKVCFKEPCSDMTDEKGKDDFSLVGYQYVPSKPQDQDFIRDQDKNIKQPSSFKKWEISRGAASQVPMHRKYGRASRAVTDERWRREVFPEHHEIQDPGSAREQVYDKYQSGLSTECQAPLLFQSGVDREEEKKERQKQYLRHRRLFMDIEREKVKEQQRQKEQRKKIEKIKKKREQQRYAEEQRILRMSTHEETCPKEKMSQMLAQLQLEETKGAREKQQREKEYLRYVEALRAQIQEKMRLYNITLPPLCCCGPDFWDAHPDTCANNCTFYKNPRAYTRALHSVINSCDTSEGNSALRVAIHNFASAHRRTLKNL
ncbi:coiled-coil domain-containing protein 15 isoform X1 [Nycticebus coucang]|uniref:coiled-coil domain-containing protein 15 isoform X1 n=1 Tax=Nycticebus coucang TaxID=9470 RepID=UPI00234D241D|nr:coiled-coil domain-containing protein 15 isoform X1 [Nycticebus coucang]